MRNSGLPFFIVLFVLAAVIALACGSPMTRSVQSITISPATADAQNYPDGEVQFKATAFYTTPPSPVTPISATWGACYQNAPTTDVSVSTNGIAHCASGAVGTYTVWGFVVNQGPGACPAFGTACDGGGCQVTGTAQLVCR